MGRIFDAMFRLRRRVYCDNNATTIVSPAVRKRVNRVLARAYGNPSSLYKVARDSAAILSDARRTVAAAINADPAGIVFTGGASEANNTMRRPRARRTGADDPGVLPQSPVPAAGPEVPAGMTMKRAAIALSLLLLLAPALAFAAPAEKFDFDALLARAIEAYGRVNDLVCSFNTRERIRDEILEKRNILYKFRKPASFYMKMTEGDNKGTELIYVEGKYGNKLEVHLRVFWGFVRVAVDPRGKTALKDHRHPVMDSDPGHLLELIALNYRRAKDDPETRITYEGEAVLDGRKTVHARAVFPAGKDYYGRTVDLYFDREIHLPVKLTVHGWNDELLEEYLYEKIRLNVGLTDRDFDIANPEYGF